MADYSPVMIRCIRSYSNKSDDDIIRIAPIKNSNSVNNYEYRINYTYPTISVGSSVTNTLSTYGMTMNYSNMFPYLHNLLSMLKADGEPFLSIQFDIPGSPSIIVKAKDIESVRNVVIDQFYTISAVPGAWPSKTSEVAIPKKEEAKPVEEKKVVSTKKTEPSSKKHKFFDEDGNTITSDDYPYPYNYEYDYSFDNEY
jgi:hypothetical protein